MGQWHALSLALDTFCDTEHVIKDSFKNDVLVKSRKPRQPEQILGDSKHPLLGAIVKHRGLSGRRGGFRKDWVFRRDHNETGGKLLISAGTGSHSTNDPSPKLNGLSPTAGKCS